MNNLVFNNHAQQLKTSIYGVDSQNQQQQIKVDDTSGAILIQSAAANPLKVEVDNATPVTVTGNVGLTGTPIVSIDTATPLNVTGNVGITGTPTVAIDTTTPLNVTGNVGITGTPTVTIDDTAPVNVAITNSFVENTSTATPVAAGADTIILANQDISTLREGTFFVYNEAGSSPVTVTLQIRPNENATYITDQAVSPVIVAAGEGVAIHLSTFAKQAQLSCSVATGSANVTGYFNGQRR